MRARLAPLSLILLAASSSLAEEGSQPKAPADAQEFAKLVAQLNDDDYGQREAAAEKLVDAGPAAVPALVEGLASDQAEVAWRSGAALEQIAVSGEEQTLSRIVAELQAAAKRSQRSGLKELAAELHARQRTFRRDRASAKIREQGGRLIGGPFGYETEIDPFGVEGMVLIDGPVMVADLAVPADVPLPVLEPAEEAEGLLPGLARVIFRALVPPAVEKEAEAEPAKEEAPKADEGAKEPARPAVVEKEDLERKEAAPIEDSKPPPADEVPVDKAADEFKEDLSLLVEGVVPVVADDAAVEVWEEETGASAQLVLDRNWRGGDDTLAVLADLPEIGQVTLLDAPLTDKALAHLARLPRLNMLQVRSGKLSREALLKFHAARPAATVYCTGDAMMGVNADFGGSPLVLTAVSPGSGAASAGLREGDIVHEVDGVKVRDFSDLTICVSMRKAGDKLKVVYEREGKKQTCEVKLTSRAGAR